MAGKYGPGCKYNCSRHCRDGDPCNATTGACDTGCEAGYIGEMCDKGYFYKHWYQILFFLTSQFPGPYISVIV